MIELDRIYQEDCLETLKRLEDNSIDLIITSPPYNKGYWSRNRRMGNGFHTKSRRIDYGVFDDCMVPEEYERWQRQILDECVRVIKPEGSIFYNHTPIQRDLNEINPTFIYDYPLKQTIIWNRNSTCKMDKSYFFPFYEYIFWLKKNKEARPYFDRHQALFRNSIWTIMPDKKNDHPAPFPIELPENIILSCSKEGDIVYDPFMGSGTVAIAAKKHNRHYLGSELSQEYVDDAERRIKDNAYDLMSNAHLHAAKKARNDCFYTRREDVDKELAHYEDQLEGKWVYMPFDTAKSAFWQYFKDNFNKLKLKHITATSWYQDNPDGKGHRLDYDGETETDIILEGNGSFDSPECTEIMKACDLVCSNVPFSRFRDIIKWLKNDKEEKLEEDV